MKNLKLIVAALAIITTIVMPIACGSNSGNNASQNRTVLGVNVTGPNVLPITVGGPSQICGSDPNLPCTTITVCTSGTQNCQTITDVLVDTGSVGLRLFSSVLSVGLTQETDSSGNSIAECAQFGSGSTWGPVQKGDVYLSGESPVTIPIQVINAGYHSVPSQCTSLETSPATSGFNGIIGVGLFQQDCGSGCVTNASNLMYYSCTNSTCANAGLALTKQVSNPVVSLTTDNNGVLLVLPALPAGGVYQVNGALVLGIGTQTNNMPGSAVKYAASTQGNFTTVFNGTTYTNASFIDSGSNGLFFPPPSNLASCDPSGPTAGFFCPAAPLAYTATISATSGSPSIPVNFSISNAGGLISTGASAFNNLGGDQTGAFDWGLPFFYGQNVFVGFEGKSSSLGMGPYWAF